MDRHESETDRVITISAITWILMLVVDPRLFLCVPLTDFPRSAILSASDALWNISTWRWSRSDPAIRKNYPIRDFVVCRGLGIESHDFQPEWNLRQPSWCLSAIPLSTKVQGVWFEVLCLIPDRENFDILFIIPAFRKPLIHLVILFRRGNWKQSIVKSNPFSDHSKVENTWSLSYI